MSPSRNRADALIDRVKAAADKRPLESVDPLEVVGATGENLAPKSQYSGPAFGPNSVVAKKWRAK